MTFQSSDRKFLQFRGVLDAHCRVLLNMQHEIERLEKELDPLGREDAASEAELRNFSVFSNRQNRICTLSETRIDSAAAENATTVPAVSAERMRSVIMSDLQRKLSEYGTGSLQWYPEDSFNELVEGQITSSWKRWPEYASTSVKPGLWESGGLLRQDTSNYRF